MSEEFAFREGTNDEVMFRHLATHNEYELPDQFEKDATIVDIGLHIGGFAHLALSRGARRLYGFEAEAGNFSSARHNLAKFGDRAILANKAVWRSDRPVDHLNLSYSADPPNTGANSVIWDSANGPAVEAVSLDDVLLQASDGGRRRVTLLKIDCEGSEFPILLTAQRLDMVDRIAGEFHEYGCPRNPKPIGENAKVLGVEAFTVETLVAALERAGFAVNWHRHDDSFLGLFFAERRDAPAPPAPRSFWRRLTARAPHFARPQRSGRESPRTSR